MSVAPASLPCVAALSGFARLLNPVVVVSGFHKEGESTADLVF